MSYYSFDETPETQDVDVAIVGAGIAGLYCAWRLVSTNTVRTVAVIERLNRTGGRLNSDIVTINEGEDVRIEQGGMRFNYRMDEMMRLTSALGLCHEIVEFPMSSNVPGKGNTNRYYERGRRFTFQNALDGKNQIWSEIFSGLSEDEKGRSPSDLIRSTYEALLKANGVIDDPDRTPEFWTKFRNEFTWKDVPLRNWTLWELMGDMGFSEGCREMLAEVSGFAGLFKGDGNAGASLQVLADFPADPRFFTFKKGFATLPNAIEKKLNSEFKDRVHILLSTNVERVVGESGSFGITTSLTPETESAMTNIPEGEAKLVRAKKLIVAAASQGTEKLVRNSPALNRERLLWAVTAVQGMALMKINLYFEKPWWALGDFVKPPLQFGPNFTDLQANSVYPFYSLPAQTLLLSGISAEENSGIRDAAAALTIYCDFNKIGFWRDLQEGGGEMFTSPLQRVENARSPQRIWPASKKVVEEAKKQLALLFGCEPVPEPVLTSYRSWDGRQYGQQNFENAYHLWKEEIDDAAVRDFLVEPIPGVHFCNEAYSDWQAWVDGSLRSANAILRKLQVPPLRDEPCKPKSESRVEADRDRLIGLWGG